MGKSSCAHGTQAQAGATLPPQWVRGGMIGVWIDEALRKNLTENPEHLGEPIIRLQFMIMHSFTCPFARAAVVGSPVAVCCIQAPGRG